MPTLATRTHALLDYALGLLLLAAPWLLGFAGPGGATRVPMAAGALLLLYSLTTDYEFGAVRQLQVPVHLWLDGILGVVLAISPWLFGFDRDVWIPHVAAGVLLVLVAFLTDTIPGYERRRASR